MPRPTNHRWRHLLLLLCAGLFLALAVASLSMALPRARQILLARASKGSLSHGPDGHDHQHHDHHPPAQTKPVNTLAAAAVPCILGFAGPYPCRNVDLMALVPTNALSGGGTGADLWGWTDPETGREYAIMSHSAATSFTDVTDPANPVYLGHLPLPPEAVNVLWRDVDVYNNHAYIIGDGDFGTNHGLQIFDLTQLRDVPRPPLVPVVFTQSGHYTDFSNSHTLFINQATGFAYAVGSNTCSGGPHMLDLSQDPTEPVFVGCDAHDGYTHENQCVVYHGPDAEHQGKEICFNSNEDSLTIVDVTDKGAPAQLSKTTYEGYAYVHQGWLTEDQAGFVSNDELDEVEGLHNAYTYLWDMADLDAPRLTGIYTHTVRAIDHNLYIKDGLIFEGNYTSGLHILDASEVVEGRTRELAYFDTVPGEDGPAFAGTWGNYPFFESGTVIVSNIDEGLFVLRPTLPNLRITKDQPSGTAAPGNTINYTIRITNTGTVTATGVVVTDTINGQSFVVPGPDEIGVDEVAEYLFSYEVTSDDCGGLRNTVRASSAEGVRANLATKPVFTDVACASSPTPTHTSTPTATPTSTQTPTQGPSPTVTPTPTRRSHNPSPTSTATVSGATPTATGTAPSNTTTPSPTGTTAAVTPSVTGTAPPGETPSVTTTPAPSVTATGTRGPQEAIFLPLLLRD